MRQELEGSLRRLGTDYIDLYQVHWPDTRTPIAETAALLAGFQREGKVRALGVSNFSVAQMEEFRRVAPLASNQPPYNLFDRAIDEEGEWKLHRFESGARSTIRHSHLEHALPQPARWPSPAWHELRAGDIRRVDPKFQEPRFSQYRSAVERLAALAKERYGKSVLELAVRWVLDRPGVSVALWGARRPQQLDAVNGVLGWKLDAAAMAEIDRIVNESVTDPVGPEYLTPRVREVPLLPLRSFRARL
jgi:aryl-alcohol dehydrogenase-like predicted oxidoreductase